MKRIATVTCLASYRAARHAVRVLVGLLHDPPWLAGVRVELVGKDPVIVVRVHSLNDQNPLLPASARELGPGGTAARAD